MLKAYKYRIYPNGEQKELLAKHFGCVRYVYNWGLGVKKETYETTKKTIGNIDLINRMKSELKEEHEWLREVNSQSLQMSLRNLDSAYKHFFREKKGFPKFKSKHDNKQSFQCPQNTKVYFDTQTITITKIPNIKAVYHRKFSGKIKTTTISKTAFGNYYVSVLVDTSNDKIKPKEININTALGVDAGIKDFLVCSNGSTYENNHYLKNKLRKLKLLQRRHSKKEKKSNNRTKSRLKIAKLHENIKNQRLNYIHQITSKLVHDNQVSTICIEDLNIKGMQKNRHLSQSISDVGIGKFYEILTYKCDWNGVNLVKIGRFEPSSKLCHKCGWKYKALKLSEREWTCEKCNTKHDRDFNASINIRNIGVERTEYKSVECPLVDDRSAMSLRSNGTMKQKKRGSKTSEAPKSLA